MKISDLEHGTLFQFKRQNANDVFEYMGGNIFRRAGHFVSGELKLDFQDERGQITRLEKEREIKIVHATCERCERGGLPLGPFKESTKHGGSGHTWGRLCPRCKFDVTLTPERRASIEEEFKDVAAVAFATSNSDGRPS